MDNKDLKLHIQKSVNLEKIYIKGDDNHIHIIAIGNIFTNLKQIERQKIIYKPITKYIIKKKIHAVTINTFTPLEWKKKINIHKSNS